MLYSQNEMKVKVGDIMEVTFLQVRLYWIQSLLSGCY